MDQPDPQPSPTPKRSIPKAYRFSPETQAMIARIQAWHGIESEVDALRMLITHECRRIDQQTPRSRQSPRSSKPPGST